MPTTCTQNPGVVPSITLKQSRKSFYLGLLYCTLGTR